MTLKRKDEVKEEVLSPQRSRGDIIRERQQWLRSRQDFSATDLVPRHIHEIYAQIWRGEELLRQEQLKRERKWYRRLLARIW